MITRGWPPVGRSAARPGAPQYQASQTSSPLRSARSSATTGINEWVFNSALYPIGKVNWVASAVTISTRPKVRTAWSAGARTASAATGPPNQSRYCGLSVLLVTVTISAVARNSQPRVSADGLPSRSARRQSVISSSAPSAVSTVLTVISNLLPAPKISKALYLDSRIDQTPTGCTARPSISGVASTDSICRPRAACQCSGDSVRRTPPSTRARPPTTIPVLRNPTSTGRRSARRIRKVGSITAGHSFSAAPSAVSTPASAGRRIAASTAPPASTAGTRSNRK